MKYIIALTIIFFLINKFYQKDKKNIIENGNIIFNSFSDSYNLDNFINDLKYLKIYNIREIEKAYLKNKKLIVKENKPHIVIYNGILDQEELKKINKNRKFIFDLLEKRNLKMDKILYAVYLNNNLYIGLRIAK